MLSISTWRRRIVFWGGGLTVGLVCVLFAVMCDHINRYFSKFALHYSWAPLIITPFGFMLIVWIMRYAFVGTEGSGIPQVMAALQTNNMKKRQSFVSFRIAIGKFFLTGLGFLCGASIGREGPTIQLSAAMMHMLNKTGSFFRHDAERGLLLAGGAAGIAAAFNAPLAGIVFAIEELSGSFEKGISGTIITTVVLCGIVAQGILGNYQYFGSSSANLNIFPHGWLLILVIAVGGGALGGLFSLALIYLSKLMHSLLQKHRMLTVGGLGLAVALIGFLSHGLTYGSGYEAAKAIIMHQSNVQVGLDYGPLKLLATLLTYLSGIPGGIFAPSLSAGAGFGQLFAHFFDPSFADAAVLLCTIAYFSGVVQSPITAFVIVLEMTNTATSNMLLPIMLTSVMASAVSKVICREPLYHALAARYFEMLKAPTAPDKQHDLFAQEHNNSKEK